MPDDQSTSARTVPTIVRPTKDEPLGDVRGSLKSEVGAWLRSPALDFFALLVIGGLLVLIGLIMVLSSSSVDAISKGQSGYSGFLRQGAYAAVGLVALIVAVALPARTLRSPALLWVVLIGAMALQLLVFTPLGININGNRNWVRLGPVTGQPAEFLKLALALWLGSILAVKRKRLRDVKHLMIPLAPVVLLCLGLVLAGRDLGTVMIMAFLVAGALWVAGVPKRWFMIGGGIAVVGVIAAAVMSPNRMARIDNWLHGVCEGDSCFQAQNGLAAIAEGGWWGVGLGASRQKWGRIPHADNDYIFAVIGEEFGLLGTLSVLALFLLLGLVLFRMTSRLREPAAQITIAGISCWILGQALVNMMVVAGLLPVLGVPLPFVSAGGSALVASMLALGVLLNYARSEPGADAALRARAGLSKRSGSVISSGHSSRK